MSESLQNRAGRALPWICDACFFLFLSTEILFEHTLVSRVCMALFLLAVLLRMIVEQKAFFALFMPCSLAMIAWGAVGAACFALSRSASSAVVKTLCVNLAFLFCFYQYLMLSGNLRRVFNVYMLSAAVVLLYTLVRCWPIELTMMSDRFGPAAGINPNWIGMVAAVSFGVCMQRALNREPKWWLAAAFFLGMLMMTKSMKAYGMVAVFVVALLLMRWPRRWGLKLALAVVLGFLFFRYVLIHIEWIDDIFFRRIRHTYAYLFQGVMYDESLHERLRLFRLAWDALCARPLTGYGLDGFSLLAGAEGTYSHNNYTELLVGGGVPMLLLYYLPIALGLRRGGRTAEKSPALRLSLLLVGTQLVMDVAMVAYIDRTALLLPVFLYASTRLSNMRSDDGRRAYSNLTNPCRIVRWCSHHDYLKWMPDRLYLKLLYRGCMGRRLHLDPPVRMSEKLQWMKLYDRDPRYPKLADKLSARDYVAEKAGDGCLVPLLGVWESANAIDFSALPERFVLKCTHDSGGVRVCADRARFDANEARAFLKRHLSRSYYYAGREWPYKALTPRVLAEAYIGDDDGAPPDDYKFFCFDGAVRAVLLCTNRTKSHADYYFFDRDFCVFPVNDVTAALPEGTVFEKPAHYDEMLRLAETLSAGLRHVRVDLYDALGRVWFGELTLFDQSGFATDYVGDGDTTMGSFLSCERKEPKESTAGVTR